MSDLPVLDCIPKEPEDTMYDVAVVGSGIGGATLGHNLAKYGHSVIFLERGRALHLDPQAVLGERVPYDADAETRLRYGRWPYPLYRREGSHEGGAFHPLGAGTGGTSMLFGMVMDRMRPSDFTPRASFSAEDVRDSSVPERWPITYDEMVPHYERVEALYRVRGTDDPLLGMKGNLLAPPDPSPKESAYTDAIRDSGLHPYRIHYACEHVPECDFCPAWVCPRSCRNDATKICLRPALENHSAKVLPSCRVIRLEEDNRKVTAAVCNYQGREVRVRARVFVLAAGAYMTPAILLRSTSARFPDGLANSSGMVGRNLMLHASDFIAVELKKAVDGGMNHGIAFNDFYLHEGTKIGNVHMHPMPITGETVAVFLHNQMETMPRFVQLMVRRAVPTAARIGGYLKRKGAVFATVVEDLPYASNRLMPKAGSEEDIVYEYSYAPELRRRNDLLLDGLRAKLKPRFTISGFFKADNLNKGHVCGTVRFGEDPKTSVLDRDCRAHDLDNLYVADASIFPSSGGINPSLTNAANSLRVSEAVHRRL